MKSFYVNGAAVLFISNIFGKIIGAVYKIPLSNILGTEGIGLYQMAFPIYSFLLVIITGGISVILTKKTAYCIAENTVFQKNKNFAVAKKIALILGSVFFLLIVMLAYPIALLQGNANATYGHLAISIGFIFACMLSVYRGYYQGHANMFPTAISQVMEQFFKLLLGLTLSAILIKKGILYGVIGALIGVSISEILSLIYFVVISKSKINKAKVTSYDCFSFFKECVPISLSSGIFPLSSLIDSLLVVNLLNKCGYLPSYSTSLFGIESGMIIPLINLPNVLIVAIALSAMPILCFNLNKVNQLGEKIHLMIKFTYILIFPCMVGMFILSENILQILYPTLSADLFNVANVLLKFSMFEMFFLCFVTITNSILQAIGRAGYATWSLFCGVCIKTLVSILLIQNFNINIFGLVIASTFGFFVTSVLNIIKIKKHIFLKFSILELLIPILLSVGIGVVLYIVISKVSSINVVGLGALIIAFAVAYFLIMIITRQISFKQLKNMLQKTST